MGDRYINSVGGWAIGISILSGRGISISILSGGGGLGPSILSGSINSVGGGGG